MRAGEIYGDVANIAARVQALAEPGAVLGHGAGAAPGRRAVCGGRARHAHAQGRPGADRAVPAGPRERRRPPFRRSAISRRWSAATTK